jgi:hypothetical protein
MSARPIHITREQIKEARMLHDVSKLSARQIAERLQVKFDVVRYHLSARAKRRWEDDPPAWFQSVFKGVEHGLAGSNAEAATAFRAAADQLSPLTQNHRTPPAGVERREASSECVSGAHSSPGSFPSS